MTVLLALMWKASSHRFLLKMCLSSSKKVWSLMSPYVNKLLCPRTSVLPDWTLSQTAAHSLTTLVYCKKTHTGRYLCFRSHHHPQVKFGVIYCLKRRQHCRTQGSSEATSTRPSHPMYGTLATPSNGVRHQCLNMRQNGTEGGSRRHCTSEALLTLNTDPGLAFEPMLGYPKTMTETDSPLMWLTWWIQLTLNLLIYCILQLY